MAKKPGSGGAQRDIQFKIALQGKDTAEAAPQLIAVAVDANGKTLKTVEVGATGEVKLPAAALDKSVRLLIGPKGMEPGGKAKFVPFHRFQVLQAAENATAIDLAEGTWRHFLMFRQCVSGRARHCEAWVRAAEIQNLRVHRLAKAGVLELADRSIRTDAIFEPIHKDWRLCTPLCDGVVEVYRRNCCCFPFVIYDPRIPEILHELERIVHEIPPIRIRPVGPDPIPERLAVTPFFKDGAEDERALNAEADLAALRALPAAEQVAYIEARPYLWCTCSEAELVTSGFLQPDGTFDICWDEWPRLMWFRCHDEYAFKIKQLVEDATVTIYDGVAAGRWFRLDDDIVLTSYHPHAIVCGHPSEPPEGATTTSVMLEAIRSTNSKNLNSPLPDGWDRVPAPSGNDGLAFPAVAGPAGTVEWTNVGWGLSLPLRYLFFDDLEPIATFYRLSVVKADANGHPTGTRKYLTAPLKWTWHRRRTDLTIKPESYDLGPVPASDHLYRIPYRSLYQALLAPGEIGEWAFGQFHGSVDSTSWGNGRHLVTLELFDAGQNLIKPTSAPATDPGTAAGFSYQAWDQADLSATVPVDYGALTHLFWWDNRQTDATILSVNKGGAPFTEECLFLEGPRTTNVSLGYRAKHDEPLFLYWHDVRWKRGLFTSWQDWVAQTSTSVDPGVTPNRTYDQLLETKNQCAFSVEVRTRAKITHGSGRIDTYDDRDNGAFAIVSPLP
ncbi:MAG: hypothetical protein KDD47_19015 [Acidobacteria bacterium]|nr:hypothetical protein [Acidobacteriota bacterium]